MDAPTPEEVFASLEEDYYQLVEAVTKYEQTRTTGDMFKVFEAAGIESEG